MSQTQDMAAINDMVLRTTPTNAAAAALQDTWIQWYAMLPAFERDYDSDALADAKARRDAFNRAMSNGAVNAPGPVAPVSPGPKPTIKQGSSDPKGAAVGPVHEWQAIVGATPIDGIFGSKTATLTKAWQKAHGLAADGIVGQLTWTQALANSQAVAALAAPVAVAAQQAVNNVLISQVIGPLQTAVATAAENMATQVAVRVATPEAKKAAELGATAVVAAASVQAATPTTSSGFPVIRQGSTGESVKTWQGMIGVSPADGIFGPDTASKTKSWQASHGLTADGIVGPATWTAAALPGSSSGMTDPIGDSFVKATNAVQGAFLDLHRLTPTWLKATGAVLAGWSALLLFSSARKKT